MYIYIQLLSQSFTLDENISITGIAEWKWVWWTSKYILCKLSDYLLIYTLSSSIGECLSLILFQMLSSIILFFFFKYLFLFIYLWLCWVFVSVQGPSPVAASGGHPSSRCAGLSLSRHPLPWSTDSRHAGSAVVAHGPSHSVACGILPDQGSNPCPLHWQADSQPLCHQGSPVSYFLILLLLYLKIILNCCACISLIY